MHEKTQVPLIASRTCFRRVSVSQDAEFGTLGPYFREKGAYPFTFVWEV